MKFLKPIVAVLTLAALCAVLSGCGHGGNLITHTLI